MHSLLRSFGPRLAVLERRPDGWRSPRRSRVLGTLIGVAMLSAAISVVCLWQVNRELYLRRLSNESRGWSSAIGEIVDAELNHSGGRGPSVSAAVHYRFIGGMKTFEGRTIAFASPRGPAAETAVRRYRPGTRVRVFFRPSDPRLSVLETGSWTGWPVVGALAFAGIGALFFTLAILRVSVRVSHEAQLA
jgi:Protein of unknown function (DUF3592)